MPVDPLEAFGLFYKDNSGPVFRALLAGTLNRAAAEDASRRRTRPLASDEPYDWRRDDPGEP